MLFFFFSSRRRHTRSKRDWSSDVCSSDLFGGHTSRALRRFQAWVRLGADGVAGRSEERREGKSVDLGGRRIIKKKKKGNRCTRVGNLEETMVHSKSRSDNNT